MHPEYLPDSAVNADDDQQIRDLLMKCFTIEDTALLQTQRWFYESPAHRWVIRDERGVIVAHMAAHAKRVVCEGASWPIGGIADVCVHPEHRGRGHVRAIAREIHEFLRTHGFVFSVLFGSPKVYGSSGYVSVKNIWMEEDLPKWLPCLSTKGKWKNVPGMVYELSDMRWFGAEMVELPGLAF